MPEALYHSVLGLQVGHTGIESSLHHAQRSRSRCCIYLEAVLSGSGPNLLCLGTQQPATCSEVKLHLMPELGR